MPKMFTSGFKPKSTTKEAKQIIRREIKGNYGYGREKEYGVKTAVEAMRIDANNYSVGRGTSDWNKGKELVNAGCFACYYDDQRKMLSKIYGKRNVDKWDGQKVHNTYGNLIGREYASMLKEKQKSKKSVKKKTHR